jgi:hypothetical protein
VGRIDLPRNIAVAEVNAPEVAESGLPIRIRVRVRASGYPGPAEVKLSRKRAGEKGYEPVGSETVQLAAFEAEAVVNLTDIPPRDGRYRYLAEVATRPGEETNRDNQRVAEVMVAAEKCRVLVVAGGPSREYRYLTRFFIRDPGIQVSAWLQSADHEAPQDGDLVLRALPATEEELRPYDVVVLLDPDAGALPQEFLAVLERFVSESGGGLAFVAGEHYTRVLASTPQGERLRLLLPVELGPDPPAEHPHSFRPELTAAGAAHALCQLRGAGEENRKLWAVLPRFYFRFPVEAVKPGATALLHDGASTVAAVHQAGAGRVLFVATDDLWRWREYREEIHEQFWSGTARFLALGKRLAGTRQVTINTDRERYRIGEEGRIEAHVLDASHQPLSGARVTALLERTESPPLPDGEEGSSSDEAMPLQHEVFLDAVPSRPGWFRGRLKLESPGNYRLALKDMAAEGLPATFMVARPTSETEDPAPDFSALAEVAKRSGGTFGPLTDILDVPSRIPDRTVVEVLGRKTATVWDSAVLLFIFSGALIVEWSLRKKWRLT